MTAQEALNVTNSNPYKNDAVAYGIKSIECRIKKYAEKGERSCLIDFCNHPGGYKDFESKYGTGKIDFYRQYNVEKELRDYFEGNGFRFKLVTDDICGGVRQDPYWIICW